MKSYQITLPPKHAGVYLLKNQTAKAFYVGQSTNLYRRFCEWRSQFQGGYGIRSSTVHEAVKASNLDDWEFVILKEAPGATAEQLQTAEASAIKAFDARGIPLLNHQSVQKPVVRAPGARALVSITHQGNPVTYREAAVLLKCSVKTVAKRAARYRGRGSETIRLEDWMLVSEKYRA